MKREEIIKALRCCGGRPDRRDCEEKCPYFCGIDMSRCIPNMTSDASDMLESDADEIAALKAENERIRQNYISPERVKAQQWISVKDRLPEKLEPVNIVWVNRKPERYYAEIEDKPFVATGYYWNDKWWWYSATCEDYLAEYGRSDVDAVDEAIEITHWMPLPEPPKEAQK